MSAQRFDLRPGVTEPVVLLISRREIEFGDVCSVVDRLLTQFRDPQSIWRYRGQLTLVIDGYNQDPRELVDIREVRSFLQEFDRNWPRPCENCFDAPARSRASPCRAAKPCRGFLRAACASSVSIAPYAVRRRFPRSTALPRA
jgi:hypothetical protein